MPDREYVTSEAEIVDELRDVIVIETD